MPKTAWHYTSICCNEESPKTYPSKPPKRGKKKFTTPQSMYKGATLPFIP